MSHKDVVEVPTEVVFDWLFPDQRDREVVADVLNQPTRKGAQAVLQIASPTGRRRMLCTFLHLPSRHEELWLLLASEPDQQPEESRQTPRFLRQFARGLSHLLNDHLTTPIGLAEIALDRDDLSPEMAAWFEQILTSCQRAGKLIGSLQELASATPGDTVLVSLSQLVRDFLEERMANAPERSYELTSEWSDADLPVRVNCRMMKVVLGHLFANAEHAVMHSSRRSITVRVFADGQKSAVV